MYKFLKIADDFYGLYVDKDSYTDDLVDIFSKKLEESVSDNVRRQFRKMGSGDAPEISMRGLQDRLLLSKTHKVDYLGHIEKYGAILISPNGSYRGAKDYGSDFIHSNTLIFPSENVSADIVICENDSLPEKDWLEYLTKRFPNKTIHTIGLFSGRTEKELEILFKSAKYITFKTTFSRTEWFEKMCKVAKSHQTIIGYCPGMIDWEIELAGDIEEYKNFKGKVESIKYLR